MSIYRSNGGLLRNMSIDGVKLAPRKDGGYWRTEGSLDVMPKTPIDFLCIIHPDERDEYIETCGG